MPNINFTYSKKRKEFGRPTDFNTYEPDPLCEIAPNSDVRAQFEVANPCSTDIQNVPVMTEAQTNTETVHLKSRGMFHTEGGWPLNIDPAEFEEKMKYCKKIERDDSYYSKCSALIHGDMIGYLKQNTAINIYGQYFPVEEGPSALLPADDPEKGTPYMKVVSVIKDPSGKHRTAAALSWFHDNKRLAVAYCNLRYQGLKEGQSCTHSYIWDMQDPNHPAETLCPSSPLTCIEFYTKDPHLVAGGSHSGIVQYWDTRQAQRIAASSLVEESHNDPVWSVKWLQSKSGELLSVSTDGQALVWDLRLADRPMEIHRLDNDSLILEVKAKEWEGKGILGGVCLDYDPQVGGPAKYMIGTEQGAILCCNRKGKTPGEKIGSNIFIGHHGPVYTVQRNPQYPKYFLSIGDWTARLWYEDFKFTNTYQTFYHKSFLSSGCWSPVRPAVFFTTSIAGYLEVWDLLHRQACPVLSMQVSECGLRTIKATNDGRHLAVGSVDGVVSTIELSPGLSNAVPNEKNSITHIFDNASARDKNLDKQAKERKALMGKRKLSRISLVVPQTVTISGKEEASLAITSTYLAQVKVKEKEDEVALQQMVDMRERLIEDVYDGVNIEAKAMFKDKEGGYVGTLVEN